MSSSNPLTAMFEQQRTAIEQTQIAAHRTVTAQQIAAQRFASGLETTKQLQTHGNEMKRITLHTYVEAIERATPAVDLTPFHEMVDEGVDVLIQNYEQNWETAIDGVEQFGEATDEYTETVDDSFDSFLAAQAQIEDSTSTVVEQVESAVPDEVAAD